MSNICRTKWLHNYFRKYKSIIKEKEKKQVKIILLEKTKLNSIEVVTSRTLIDSYISHNEFVSVKMS